ncbi:MAG TPA: DoxX family protein [Actinomycetota bacterium]|nr:DoxX family protein [Actinomycetota bacterium]
MDLGLLLLRVVVGTIMALHGAQKAFGAFGGPGMQGTERWLGSMGFRPARLHASVIAAAELVGGAFLVLGFFTPLAAAAIIGVMIVAIATVHWENGLFNTSGGYEFNLVLMTAAGALAFTGAGAISFDNAFGLGLQGAAWGLLAYALAAVGAVVTMTLGRQVSTEPAADEGLAEGDRVIDLSEERTRVDA